MSDITVARRYASAMIEVAAEIDAVDIVGTDLARFVRVLDQDGGQLRGALCTPVFTVEERERVLDDLLPRLNLQPVTRNLLRLANQKRRLPLIGEIARVYMNLADERAGRARVQVATAEPLSPQIEAEVRAAMERLTGKHVLLETRVDPSLIGGLVARVGSKVYDSSIRTRLQNMRQTLLAAQVPGQA